MFFWVFFGEHFPTRHSKMLLKTDWWWKPSQWDLNCARRTMCSLWYEVINSVILQWADRNQDTFFFWVIAVGSGTIFQLPVLRSSTLHLSPSLHPSAGMWTIFPPSSFSPSSLLHPRPSYSCRQVASARNAKKENVHLMFDDRRRQSSCGSVSVAIWFAKTLSNFDLIFQHKVTAEPLILRQR